MVAEVSNDDLVFAVVPGMLDEDELNRLFVRILDHQQYPRMR
jgi:hypothetical protein